MELEEQITYLEALTESDQIRHSFVHFAFHEGLSLLSQTLFLVRDKITEGREGICWRLNGRYISWLQKSRMNMS